MMAEKTTELTEMALEVGNLLKKEDYLGQTVYMHIVFAQKAMALATKIGIVGTTHYIDIVHRNLPAIIHNLVPSKQENWMTFTKAIQELETTDIREKLAKYKEKMK